VWVRGEEASGGTGSSKEEEFHLFECTEANKNEHFEKMAAYLSHMIPFLELMDQHSDTVGDEHKKHKEDLKKMIAHFKKYKETKEALKTRCDDPKTTVSLCCQEIKALEKKFHDEMDHFNHDEAKQ
jgi:predicted  nucleic acid-binding Zn-ribbon protein